MHRHPVVLAFVLAIAFVLVCPFPIGPAPHATAAQDATPAVASPSAASGDFAGLVDIGGGRSLYLECHGTGSPTVVLEAGYRASARYWSDDLLQPDAPRTMVLPAVAEFTRVCAYDRPGTYASIGEDDFVSRSDPIAQPRTAPEVVADLHALLQAAEIPGPYVLAAHSLGGLFARLYASTYPDEVVGLVLVDAYSERLETLMTPEQWAALVRLNQECRHGRGHPDSGLRRCGDVAMGRGQRGGARGGGGLAAAADAPGRPRPRQAVPAGGRRAGVHDRRVGSVLSRRRTRTWPPSSRTRASPWPPRAATTSTRINPSW